MEFKFSDPRLLEIYSQGFERVISLAVREYRATSGRYLEHCASPIEAMFWLGFNTVVLERGLLFSGKVTIAFNTKLGDYRPDLQLRYRSHKNPDSEARMVVELDGHEFHEKTKEQAERDKKRDRFFTSEGWAVHHFTGREVYRDPFACGQEVVNHLVRETRES